MPHLATCPVRTGRETLVLLRTHFVDENVRHLAARLTAESGHDVVLLADETSAALPVADLPKLAITREDIAALGVHVPDNALWLCGDYAFFVARQKAPGYGFYWMLEPDVGLHFADLGAFFAPFAADRQSDLIVSEYGPSHPDWMWHPMMAPHARQPHGCFFPVVRLSVRGIETALAGRRALSRRLADALAAGAPVWPHVEAFVASWLTDAGLACRHLNSFGRHLYARESFGALRPISGTRLAQLPPSDTLLHPVRWGASYEAALRRWISIETEAAGAQAVCDLVVSDMLDDIRAELGPQAALELEQGLRAAAAMPLASRGAN